VVQPREGSGEPYQCLSNGWCKKRSDFSVVPSNRTTGKGHKLKRKKSFLTVRVIKHLNRLPREVEESPFLEVFKT